MAEEHKDLSQALAKVEEALRLPRDTTAKPVLVMLCGLPATGKSYLARRLADTLPFAIVESDQVRKILFPKPQYSSEESVLVHRTCHALMANLLSQGVRVIYDATNLIEYHRELVYHLAEKCNVKLLTVRTIAPEEVVRQRLGRREDGTVQDLSDADWEVYKTMAAREEPIRRPHLTIDTSRDTGAAVTRILRALQR